MAQANVVREPSMDEILASIRRIIESNDPVPSDGLATSAAEPAGFSGAPANDDGEDEIVELTVDGPLSAREAEIEQRRAAFSKARPGEAYVPAGPAPVRDSDADRAYVPVSAPERVAKVEEGASRPQSLADVAARVRAASERQIQTHRSGFDPVPPAERIMQRAESPLTAERAPSPAPVETHVAEPVARTRIEPETRAEVLAPAADFGPDADALARTMAEAAVEHLVGRQSAVAYEALAPFLDEPARGTAISIDTNPGDQALLSAPAGDQVARSFTELAVAVEMSERRSFDDIATELMRPMLQEWLDDNLPTLVERLVREEIERVARGPRR